MTVKKLIEVLQQIPDQQKDVYLRRSSGNFRCTAIKQDDDGDVVLNCETEYGVYLYPTRETKGGDE